MLCEANVELCLGLEGLIPTQKHQPPRSLGESHGILRFTPTSEEDI